MADDYQPRTPGRLIAILRAQDTNPRSWQAEAADEIERLLERCEAYKGQVSAGADEIDRLRAIVKRTDRQ